MDTDRVEFSLVDQSLAQQMRITDFDVELRKQLFGLTQADAETLKSLHPFIVNNLNTITDEFYKGQRAIPEINLLIGDSETFRRLQSSLKVYVSDLFCGVYDYEYVNKRLRIGKVHKRIGVSTKLYIFSMYMLEKILFNHIEQLLMMDGDGDVCVRSTTYFVPLRKLLAFDLHLVIETYVRGMLDEVEAARSDVSRYAESLEKIVAERTRQLQDLSRSDELTGIGNQRAFYEDLRRELAVACRQASAMTLVYFDLNNFKKLNDSKGHQAGDALLRHVGQALMETARETDLPFRYGGDEFAAILPGNTRNEAKVFIVRLMAEFDKGQTEGVTFSIGMAEASHGNYPDMDTFLKSADASMYKAKEASRETGEHSIDEGVIVDC